MEHHVEMDNHTPWVAPILQCGLGNRLFQFAAAAGAAERLGRRLVFYIPEALKADHGAVATLFRLFPHVPFVTEFAGQSRGPPITIQEEFKNIYRHVPITLNDGSGANILIDGFRQSHLYFPSKPLCPDWDNALGGTILRYELERELGLETEAGRSSAVALHIRLGDYKNLPHHQIPLAQYYAEAVKKVAPGQRIIIFSDEPHLCKVIFKAFPVTFAKARADVESLYQMSRCLGGTITANSSFSWWGAWFAHAAGSAWATFPDTWNRLASTTTDLFPGWGTVIPVT
jgi:hypothetical protein